MCDSVAEMAALLCKCETGKSTTRHWHCVHCYRPIHNRQLAQSHMQKCSADNALKTEKGVGSHSSTKPCMNDESAEPTNTCDPSSRENFDESREHTRRSQRSIRPTVQCPECGLSMKKKNLNVHIHRKHCDDEARSDLKGYCVDPLNGVFAVCKQPTGPDSYIHVKKKIKADGDGHFTTQLLCENLICREAMSVASRSGLAIMDCEHTQAALSAKVFQPPPALKETKLEELLPNNANIRAAAAKLNEDALNANVSAVYPLFEDIEAKKYISFSVYIGSRPTSYSLSSRTITKYDLNEKTWICKCCKRRGCPHKLLTKWFVYETNPSLLGGDSAEDDEEELEEITEEEPDETFHYHDQLHSGLRYPPDSDEEKETMMRYWLDSKAIPYSLPREYSCPGLERLSQTAFTPQEVECPTCHVDLGKPTVITEHAILISKEAMHEGIRNDS